MNTTSTNRLQGKIIFGFLVSMIIWNATFWAQGNVSAPISVDIRKCSELTLKPATDKAVASNEHAYAFIIGVYKYNSLSQVKYAKEDLVNANNFFKCHLGVPEKNIKTNLGSEIYPLSLFESDLKKFIDRVGADISSNKVIYFYFSGHGFTQSYNNKPNMQHLLFYDGKIEEKIGFIGLQDILNQFNKFNQQSKFISFIDACGGLDKSAIREDESITLQDNQAVFTATSNGGAGGYFDEECSSSFTYHLLTQLRQLRNTNNSFTFKDWFDNVRRAQPNARYKEPLVEQGKFLNMPVLRTD
jgi:hypothetical protein